MNKHATEKFVGEQLKKKTVKYIGEITDEVEELKAYTEPGVYAYTLKQVKDAVIDEDIGEVSSEKVYVGTGLLIVSRSTDSWGLEMLTQFVIHSYNYLDEEHHEFKTRIKGDGWLEFTSIGNLSDENFTTDLKEKLDALPTNVKLTYELKKKQDFLQSVPVTQSDGSGLVYLDLKENQNHYRVEANDTAVAEGINIGLITIQHNGVTSLTFDNYTTEFTFYVYLDHTHTSTIPSVLFEIYNAEDITYGQITWLEPLSIDFPKSKNKFEFQTIDGGQTWTAKQCYCIEVK